MSENFIQGKEKDSFNFSPFLSRNAFSHDMNALNTKNVSLQVLTMMTLKFVTKHAVQSPIFRFSKVRRYDIIIAKFDNKIFLFTFAL